MDNIQLQLEAEEGRSKWVYKDSEGLDTIGIGCLIDKKGGGLDDDEIDWLFAHRRAKKERELNARFPWAKELDPARYGALVNMAYQLGVPGLAAFGKMLAALQVKAWVIAHDESLDSRWAKQTPARAQRMAKQLLTGEWQWK